MSHESRLVGTSPYVKRTSKLISKLAAGKEDVLILGEWGTGKKTLAWEINAARGKKKPYVLLDARTAIDEEVRATFTGQHTDLAEARTGRKPASLQEGMMFTIAEVERMIPHHQALLVSFLKDGRKRYSGCKVVVTLEAPLERLAQAGVLSADLVGHLEKFQLVEVPPLRERIEDIPELVSSIAKQLCKMLGKPEKEIDSNTHHILSQGQWPLNLHQLVAVVGKAVMISHEDKLELPAEFLDEQQHLADAITNIESATNFVLDQSLDLIEKLLIQRALKRFMYNQSKTASVFGLSEANFRYRLKKFGLPSIRKKI